MIQLATSLCFAFNPFLSSEQDVITHLQSYSDNEATYSCLLYVLRGQYSKSSWLRRFLLYVLHGRYPKFSWLRRCLLYVLCGQYTTNQVYNPFIILATTFSLCFVLFQISTSPFSLFITMDTQLIEKRTVSWTNFINFSYGAAIKATFSTLQVLIWSNLISLQSFPLQFSIW